MIQHILVGIIFLAAMAYVLRRCWLRLSGRQKGCDCTPGCDKCPGCQASSRHAANSSGERTTL